MNARSITTSRRLGSCVGAFAIAATVLATGSAPAALATPGAAAQSAAVVDADAKPVLDWSVPGRYDASWAAWNPTTARYTSSFVNPSAWSLNLTGCASTSLRPITAYTFTISRIGTTWTRTYKTTACSLSLHNLLPAQGYYRATVTLRTALGASVPIIRTVQIRDYLIVSMGDSLASGEGNPDVPGAYDVTYNFKGEATSARTIRTAQWKDRRCHRSAKSGPALAAKAFAAASRYTSVTFLSVACSGAEIRHMIDARYGGIEPVGSSTFPPQVDAIHTFVGGRRIDALLISAGINDLHFSDIIERCASNGNFGVHVDCVTDGGIADQVTRLPLKYLQLALAIRDKLPGTREVYVNNYPSNVFRGGACGSLAFPGVGIDAAEASEMNTWGIALSWKITEAAHTFRIDPFHWNRVNDLALPFDQHAYCDSASWFVKYEQSWATQGNKFGTAHPNNAGHVTYGNLLRRAIVLDQAARPYRRLTVTIHAIKLAVGPDGSTRSIDATLWQYQNDPYGLTHYYTVPRNGQWTAIPSSRGTFTLDVFRAPSSPRHAIALYVTLWHILPIKGTFSTAYGIGHHVLVHPTGVIAVDYTITASSPPLGPVLG
jgi:hypothetical protein